MTARHDKATEGRTEAAAVDQAIADAEKALTRIESEAEHVSSYTDVRWDSPEHDPADLHEDVRELRGSVRRQTSEVRAALRVLADAVEGAATERDEALRGNWKQIPDDQGGPGKEETYWLRNKLRSAVVHLRDIEDFYRWRGGTPEPESHNMVRADRARSLYEQISEDFLNGRLGTPTMRERALAAEAEAKHFSNAVDAMFAQKVDAEAERDQWKNRAMILGKQNQENDRLARQVADLEAFCETVRKYIEAETADEEALGRLLDGTDDDNLDERYRDEQKATRHEADRLFDELRAAARSRDPQEGA